MFPAIGKQAISTIGPRDVLTAVRKMEARGAIDSAHRVKQICGQVFRFALAEGTAEQVFSGSLQLRISAKVVSQFGNVDMFSSRKMDINLRLQKMAFKIKKPFELFSQNQVDSASWMEIRTRPS